MNYGCKGAMANGYVKWLVDTKAALSSESFYPYEVNTQSGGGVIFEEKTCFGCFREDLELDWFGFH